MTPELIKSLSDLIHTVTMLLVVGAFMALLRWMN